MSGLEALFIDPNGTYVCDSATNGTSTTFFAIPRDGFGLVQLIFLMFAYGFILAKSSKMIADGSELLLCVLDPGIVGGLVLPVMGAVPDGAIVLFSGLGPDAQEQLKVRCCGISPK